MVSMSLPRQRKLLTAFTSSVSTIIKEMKMDNCPYRDTSRFVCFFRGAKVARAGIERGNRRNPWWGAQVLPLSNG
jgi:hypothetical protein